MYGDLLALSLLAEYFVGNQVGTLRLDRLFPVSRGRCTTHWLVVVQSRGRLQIFLDACGLVKDSFHAREGSVFVADLQELGGQCALKFHSECGRGVRI